MLARTLAVSALFALVAPAHGETTSGPPKVGERPPEMGLEKLLQAPKGAVASWEALKGKVVVLEFWATWCGPCILAIPHLNDLAGKFGDKPVQFISITDEDEAKISKFLKKKPMRGWVGLDTDRSMFKGYHVRGVPHTVVVDPKGVIAAITYPDALTERVLADLLAGRKVNVPQLTHGKGVAAGLDPDGADKQRPLFQVMIRPATKEFGATAQASGRFTAESVSLRRAISIAYGVRETRVIGPPSLIADRYTLVVSVPRKKPDQWRTQLRQALRFTFDLVVREETRETDAYVLTAPKGPGPKLSPAASPASGSRSGPGYLSGTGQNIGTIASLLENAFERPVLDETGLDGRFDYKLTYDAADPESLIEAVEKQLGLKLTPATRPVEVLIVEQK